MTASDRLTRALGADRPPERDGAFVVAVIEAGEHHRHRRAIVLSVFRAAGLAAAAAAAAAWAWNALSGFALTDGLLLAGAIIALVLLMRRFAAGVAA
ncbi:MAG: hypothetical protein JNK94_10340 [Hyphomonadaceae bacterium]|nr:hypothetical protein [Hyphomonadaceae bacterium]